MRITWNEGKFGLVYIKEDGLLFEWLGSSKYEAHLGQTNLFTWKVQWGH